MAYDNEEEEGATEVTISVLTGLVELVVPEADGRIILGLPPSVAVRLGEELAKAGLKASVYGTDHTLDDVDILVVDETGIAEVFA